MNVSDEADPLLRSGEIITEIVDRVLVIRLNRPDKLNAMTRAMLNELGEIFTLAGQDPRIRSMVLTGTGKGFCAGADVGGLKASAEQDLDERLAARPRFTPRMVGLWKPTICAVNGVCAGAGLHFVSDLDIVICSENAAFTDTHVNVGQITAMEPIGLARRMPLGSVLRMVILGKAERLTPQQALEAHLVSEILPADALMDRAMELARIAASVSPAAVQGSLKAVWGSFDMPLEDAHTMGFEEVMRHRNHPDAAEGPAAFLEKREPRWQD
ncbi:enoyl-CoA hydratase/isomerase family protein [Paracoccus pantotrophus]|uniref:enoyl-CoA hydratase/isomerase family protein n=1 Tax=Paracoccus pantotrophus TaxID=82367 RepID=UPI0004B1C8F7|nr:enoyl-CoA hydratase/isomerase family protein [Paracoccus pantotrophus]